MENYGYLLYRDLPSSWKLSTAMLHSCRYNADSLYDLIYGVFYRLDCWQPVFLVQICFCSIAK